jgi:hypothetical protein
LFVSSTVSWKKPVEWDRIDFPEMEILIGCGGDSEMARLKKNPSKAGISAASVKGNAGPVLSKEGTGRPNSKNQQTKYD